VGEKTGYGISVLGRRSLWGDKDRFGSRRIPLLASVLTVRDISLIGGVRDIGDPGGSRR
jgi:hypothetical protein